MDLKFLSWQQDPKNSLLGASFYQAPISNTDKATRAQYLHPDLLFITLRSTIWTAELWQSLQLITSS